MSEQICPRCNGQGKVRDPLYRDPITCGACNGTGYDVRAYGARLENIGEIWHTLTDGQRVELVMTARAMADRQWRMRS